MKKKKLPIALMVVIATLVGIGAVMNIGGMMWNNPNQDDGHNHDQEEQPEIVASTASDAEVQSAADQLKKVAGGGNENPDGTAPADRGPKGMEMDELAPYKPAIMLPKQERHDPVLNESATASQWFDEDSLQKQKAEEKEKEAAALAGSN